MMDYPYVLNYVIMLFFAYQYWKYQDSKYVTVAFIFQFIFIAFRAPVVGADTWDYVRYLAGERNFYNYDYRDLEPGFIIYRETLVLLNCNRFMVMVINTFMSCYPLYLLIKRYSNNPPLSLAMLSILNFYSLYFCGLRQIIAIAILIMAMLYVVDNKKYKWIVFACLSFISWNFHTSAAIYAIIFLIVYIIVVNRIILIALVILSASVGIVLQTFNVFDAFNIYLDLNVGATERIEGYMENDKNVNEVESIILTLRPTIIAVLVLFLIDKEKINHWCVKLYIIGLILANLLVSIPMVNRLTGAFSIFGAIAFSWIFGNKYILFDKYRKFVNYLMVIFFLYFGQSLVKINLNSAIDFSSEGRMHPYYFIWEDYSNHPSITKY